MQPCFVANGRTLKDATCRALEVLWCRQVAPPSADFCQRRRSFGFMCGNSGEWLGIVNPISVRQTDTNEEIPARLPDRAAPTLPFDHPLHDEQRRRQGDDKSACCFPALTPQFASVLFPHPDHSLGTPPWFEAERFAASGRKIASDRIEIALRFKKFAILVGYRHPRTVAFEPRY